MTQRRHQEALEHWKAALNLANRSRLTEREDFRIRGGFALDTADLRQAETTFAAGLRLYPYDYLAAFYLAAAQRMQGNTAAAIANLQRAEQIDAQQYYTYTERAKCDLLLKKYPEARAQIDKVRSLGETGPADRLQAAWQYLTGDFVGARQTLDRLTTSTDADAASRGYLMLASLDAEIGRLQDAVLALRRGIEFDSNRGEPAFLADKRIALAWLLARLGEAGPARAEALEALRLDDSPERVMRAGTILARLHRLEDAEAASQALHSFAGLQSAELASLRLEGEILLARHRYPEALQRFEQLSRLDVRESFPEYLANAYSVTGDTERAAFYFQEIVDSPALEWLEAAAEFPGLWAECLQRFATLEAAAGQQDQTRRLQALYQNQIK